MPPTAIFTLAPAVARGVTPGTALRGMLDLAGFIESDQTTWLANGSASVLGQLAATPPTTSQAVLNAACTVVSSRKSVRGLESILLSAVLGTPPGTQEEVRAAELWSRYGAPVPGLMTAVLNPRTHELVFLTADELGDATGRPGGLRERLLAFIDTADDPKRRGESTHQGAERTFAAAMALAAGATGTAQHDPGGLAGPGASEALPGKLANGNALLVEVLLSEPEPSVSGQARDPELPDPDFPVLGAAGAAAGMQHPFWTASFRCSATVPSGEWLPALIIPRGRSYLLGATPQVGGPGSRGYLPVAVPTGTGRATTQGGATLRRVSSGTRKYVAYAPVLDPLTGAPSHYPVYPPGYGPATVTGVPAPQPGVPLQPQPGQVVELLRETVRTLELSTETPIGQVIEAINSSEYGATLNRVTRTLRGYA